MLTEISRKADNVDLLDLGPILADEIAQGNRVYGRMDIHLDDYGHYNQAVFNSVADTIRQSEALKAQLNSEK